MTVKSSTLEGNTATSNGGGIGNAGTLTLDGSTSTAIPRTTAAGSRASPAISLRVNDSTFDSQLAAYYGGGIQYRRDPRRSTAASSRTTSPSRAAAASVNYGTRRSPTPSSRAIPRGEGGGVANGGTLTVNGGTLSGNTAGAAASGNEFYATLSVNKSELSGNLANGSFGEGRSYPQ